MLLPTKGISPEKALLTVGASLLTLIDQPVTVSGLWERFKIQKEEHETQTVVSFDWFAMALTMLFALQAVEWNEAGRLVKSYVSA
ncbi:MAG: hypothetical protein GX483_00645 [Actinomycetaceae bacterium]|nr:hypothetical protein [Actinomycetaceae bacterium]